MSDELLLTPEELEKWGVNEHSRSHHSAMVTAKIVAQAQLSKLQANGWGNIEQAKREERERIIKEIEKCSHPTNTNMLGISLSKEEWQTLKGDFCLN